MKKIIILSVLGAILFTGCSQKDVSKPMLYSNNNGFSIDYKEGYNEGCDSGKNNFVRNQKLYDFFADYRYGWNKGYDDCRNN